MNHLAIVFRTGQKIDCSAKRMTTRCDLKYKKKKCFERRKHDRGLYQMTVYVLMHYNVVNELTCDAKP